jgi:uncharacterized protein (DUF849 family)
VFVSAVPSTGGRCSSSRDHSGVEGHRRDEDAAEACDAWFVVERIKVCVNGSRGSREHPAVPVTAAEIAVAAANAVAAGAEAVHLHARDDEGRESLRAEHIGAAVAAVRLASPGVPVGVSTGLWMTGGDVGRRRDLVVQWNDLSPDERPDFASVNLGAAGFGELSELLRTAGIGVEAGVWSVADAELLATAAPAFRILIEIIDTPAGRAVAAADEILHRLDQLRVPGPRLLHGEEDSCWPLIAHAGRLGLPTRIGLEDTIVGPAGEPAIDNADLIRRALASWTDARNAEQA